MFKIPLLAAKIFQKPWLQRYSGKLFLILIPLGLSACVDIPSFDNTPRIEFNSITKETVEETEFSTQIIDKVTITVNFEDGDGDLGVTSDAAEDEKYLQSGWVNYQLTTFVKQRNGTFEQVNFIEDAMMFFPVLKPDGAPGPIKGKLDLHKDHFHTNFSQPSVVKYEVKIRDRAMNVSNVIETDTISVMLDL